MWTAQSLNTLYNFASEDLTMSWNIKPTPYEQEKWPVIWREEEEQEDDSETADEDTPDWD